MQQTDEQARDGSAEQQTHADTNSPTAAPTPAGQAATAATDAPTNGAPDTQWVRLVPGRGGEWTIDHSSATSTPPAWVQHALMSIPEPPIEQRWYRQPRWTRARAQLEQMLESGDLRFYLLEDRVRPDGSQVQVKVSLWQYMHDATSSRTTTNEEHEHWTFLSKAVYKIRDELRAQGVEVPDLVGGEGTW